MYIFRYIFPVVGYQYKLFMMLEQMNMQMRHMQGQIDRLTAMNTVAAGQPLPAMLLEQPCDTEEDLMALEEKISSIQERQILVSNITFDIDTSKFNASTMNSSKFNMSTYNMSTFITSKFNTSRINTSTINTNMFNTSMFNMSTFNTNKFDMSMFNTSTINMRVPLI